MVWFLWLVQGYVLADEDADADTAQVEAIKELVDLWELCQPRPGRQLPLQVGHPHRHHRHNIAASGKNPLMSKSKVLVHNFILETVMFPK